MSYRQSQKKNDFWDKGTFFGSPYRWSLPLLSLDQSEILVMKEGRRLFGNIIIALLIKSDKIKGAKTYSRPFTKNAILTVIS